MKPPAVLDITPFAQEMRPDAEHLDEQWTPLIASQDAPWRLLSLPVPFDLSEPRQRALQRLRALETRARWTATLHEALQGDAGALEAALEALPVAAQAELLALVGLRTDPAAWQQALQTAQRPLWRRRWLQFYAMSLAHIMREVPLRGLRHLLLAWLPEGQPEELLAGTLQQTLTTPVSRAVLPCLLPGPYEEQADHLAPLSPQHPVVALLTSYDYQGRWDHRLLHRLLLLDLDLALCVDVLPIDRAMIEWQADAAAQAGQVNQDLRARGGRRDVKAEYKLLAAQEAQERLYRGEGYHATRIVLALRAREVADLPAQISQVQHAVGRRLKLMHPPGGQQGLYRYFTPTPTALIAAPVRPRTLPSAGVAVLLPWGLRKPARTDGTEWLRAGSGVPICFDPLPDNQHAAHLLIAGQTGSGKTFAILCWMLRRLTLCQDQVIVFDPQQHARRLIDAVGAGGAAYDLDASSRVNVLDSILTDGGLGLADQVEHVIALLGILMGGGQTTEEGRELVQPRNWSSLERGLLDLALQQVYQGLDLRTLAPADTPILSDLVAALRQLAEDEDDPHARLLALDMDRRLVRGSRGATFNTTSTIDWRFGAHDAVFYSFAHLGDATTRLFYYAQAFAALNRYIRGRRQGAPAVWVVVDEFGYLSQTRSIVTFAYRAVKTWRTFRAALVMADQDFQTWAGVDKGKADPLLIAVAQNTPLKAFFTQEPEAARRIGEEVPGLLPAHLQAITQARTGQCVLVWRGDERTAQTDVFTGQVVPTPDEDRIFRGT